MHEPLLDRLAATPRTAAHLVVEVPEEKMDWALDGGWGPRTILAHLRDDEYLCMRVALERMLAEERPQLRFVDGGDWVAGRNTARDRREELLADFALQRQATLSILRMLRPDDWSRTATREPGGRELTIAQLADAWADHDAEHIAQLERAVGETLEEAIERRRPA
ncbi:MAG: DinB family protein [Dehalococcoidia bacterium]|nr:DinB family protein [Dehalococcoidia bacterium]